MVLRISASVRSEVRRPTPPTSRHRPHRPLRRPRRRARACAGPGRAPPTRCARDERADAATGERAAAHRARARQAARPDARRGDEGRPGALDRRLHRDPRVRARGVQGDARLAARRRPAAAVQADREAARGGAGRRRSSDVFSDFEHEAFAAASIGQVHRAIDARRARASRSRSSTRASPRRSRPTCATCRCCSRWSSGSRPASTSRRWPASCASGSATSSTTRSRRRTTARWRAPGAGTRSRTSRRSTPSSRSRRVLVTELLEGRRFEEVKRSARPSATASARSSSASSSARSSHLRRAAGDPHPGNYLLLDDGRVGFLDFGLMRVVDADYLEGERAARAGRRRPATPPARPRRASPRSATCRTRDAFDPERAARPARDRRRVVLRARLPAPDPGLRDRPDRPRLLPALGVLRGDAARDDPAAGAADPPHGGPRALRRSASCAPAPTGTRWRASTGATAPPSTPLGEQDAAFWGVPDYLGAAPRRLARAAASSPPSPCSPAC